MPSLRNYYPDFLVQKKDGSYVIVEVKGENKIDTSVVLAKAAYARQLAVASGMDYRLIPSLKAKFGLQSGVDQMHLPYDAQDRVPTDLPEAPEESDWEDRQAAFEEGAAQDA